MNFRKAATNDLNSKTANQPSKPAHPDFYCHLISTRFIPILPERPDPSNVTSRNLPQTTYQYLHRYKPVHPAATNIMTLRATFCSSFQHSTSDRSSYQNTSLHIFMLSPAIHLLDCSLFMAGKSSLAMRCTAPPTRKRRCVLKAVS